MNPRIKLIIAPIGRWDPNISREEAEIFRDRIMAAVGGVPVHLTAPIHPQHVTAPLVFVEHPDAPFVKLSADAALVAEAQDAITAAIRQEGFGGTRGGPHRH